MVAAADTVGGEIRKGTVYIIQADEGGSPVAAYVALITA